MKVLIAHNRYRSRTPSGENSAVAEESRALSNAGVEVRNLLADSDTLSTGSLRAQAEAAIGPVYAPSGVRNFTSAIRQFRPDVVHIHNVYPLLSPHIVRAAKKHNIPILQTVHNYRHSCIKGIRFRDEQYCDDCVQRFFGWPAIRHSCYRNSRAQSASMAIGQTVHRGTWDMVDRYLCVSDYQASRVIEGGLDPARVFIKPNSVPDTGPPSPLGQDVAFIGRFSEEKGVRVILDAWKMIQNRQGRRLLMIGDGPLRGLVESYANADDSIVVTGEVDASRLPNFMARSCIIVVPSVAPETFGRVVIEAFREGRPVLASSSGALPELVTEQVGWITDPTPQAFSTGLTNVWHSRDLSQYGHFARMRYLNAFREEVITRQLIDHYQAISGAR